MRTTILFLMVVLAGCDKPIITIDLKGQPNIPAQPAPPRFQLVMHPEFPGKFTFLLDTQTGAIWSPKTQVSLQGQPTAWTREDFVESPVPSSGQDPMTSSTFLILHPPIEKEEVKP